MKAGVKIRCVQDDQTFDDLLFALLAGRASHHESARKGRAVAAGLKRAAERGEHRGLMVDGYRLAVDVDGGRVTKRLELDPERREPLDLIFVMALAGSSDADIVRALNAAGYFTKPWKRRDVPRPFTRSRVARILRNPRYAGLSVYRGQVVGPGRWPAYISTAEYDRIQMRRAHVSGAGVARLPRQAYLLCTVVVCGLCGSKMTSLNAPPRRQDGLRGRRYVCRSHQEPGGCPAPPVDAAVVDLTLVRSLPWLLEPGGRSPDRSRDASRRTDGSPDPDDEWRGPAVILEPVTSKLMRAVSEAAVSGDRQSTERALELLVSHSYARGARFAGGRTGDVIERTDDLGLPLADFDAWIAADLTGTYVADPERDGRLRRVLGHHFTDFSLVRVSNGVEITVSKRPAPTRMPDGGYVGTAGPPCRPQTLRAHHGSWEICRRAAGYRRRIHTWWSDAEILDAIREWTLARLTPPNTRDWALATDSHPTAAAVATRFGSWAAALRASYVASQSAPDRLSVAPPTGQPPARPPGVRGATAA